MTQQSASKQFAMYSVVYNGIVILLSLVYNFGMENHLVVGVVRWVPYFLTFSMCDVTSNGKIVEIRPMMSVPQCKRWTTRRSKLYQGIA